MGTPITEQSRGLRQQVDLWAKATKHGACVERLEDSEDFYACVPGAAGAWGKGPTPEAAVEELESALVDWVLLKLELGTNDIPEMDGIRLTLAP